MPRLSQNIANIPDEVKELFERETLRLIARGWRHYSSDMILHKIRWTKQVDQNDRTFKCNDHWTPYLSRWFALRHPEYAEFFEYRRLGMNHENYEFFYTDNPRKNYFDGQD